MSDDLFGDQTCSLLYCVGRGEQILDVPSWIRSPGNAQLGHAVEKLLHRPERVQTHDPLLHKPIETSSWPEAWGIIIHTGWEPNYRVFDELAKAFPQYKHFLSVGCAEWSVSEYLAWQAGERVEHVVWSEDDKKTYWQHRTWTWNKAQKIRLS